MGQRTFFVWCSLMLSTSPNLLSVAGDGFIKSQWLLRFVIGTTVSPDRIIWLKPLHASRPLPNANRWLRCHRGQIRIEKNLARLARKSDSPVGPDDCLTKLAAPRDRLLLTVNS